MDEKVVLTKIKASAEEIACDECIFEGACMQTEDMPAPFGPFYCEVGYYWVMEE